MELTASVTQVRGVGPEVAKKLAAIGIHSINDLLDYWPRRYDDYSNVSKIGKMKPGMITVKAVINQATSRYVRRGMHITEAIASDDTASVRLIWFNQPYRAGAIRPNVEYYISGQFQLSRQRLSIMNPSVELVGDFPVNTARIVPIYRESRGFKSNQLRKIISSVISSVDQLPETLPQWLLDKTKLMPRHEAVKELHFPSNPEHFARARQRLAFEEVFILSLSALLNKYDMLQEHTVRIPFKEAVAIRFVANLPFTLTDAQRRTVWQIYQDMDKGHPMNRLIEGDVGSGKTVVAAMAAIMVMDQGAQAVLMAPTELLARQHAETIYNLLEPLGLAGKVSLLVGGMKTAEKNTAYAAIQTGRSSFIIGTQALIQDKVDMHKLGLVVIDEQHRFGVDQRNQLQQKAGHMPHVLSMTATPIPRSLALTLYGELDISVLDAMPHGRKPVITKIASPNSRAQLYAAVDAELKAGRQAYVVCPLIQDNETLGIESAEKMFEILQNNHFKHRKVGLLHGKLISAQKEKVMEQFATGKIDVLVATTVVEVGVNVPNATVMIIEGAERFGLAQLHQLRGRVGRSDQQSYCYLVTSDSKAPSQRLRALEQSTNGFELAELDLELRGPGAIYGTMQHGELDLRIAKLSDTRLLAAGRSAAQQFIDSKDDLANYPLLFQAVNRARAVTRLD